MSCRSGRLCRPILLLLALIWGLAACDDFPRDPEDTLEGVRIGGVLTAGAIDNPPWIDVDPDGHVTGIEAALVERFAAEQGAVVHWVQGPEKQLLEALQRFELDLVAGGLTRDTPWRRRLGITRPYVATATLVGIPPGAQMIRTSMQGLEVAVRPGDPAAAAIREREGVVVRSDAPQRTGLAVAAEDWELIAWDYLPTSFVLGGTGRVFAVPPGENALLTQLEKFLADRSGEVRVMLAEMAEADPKGEAAP